MLLQYDLDIIRNLDPARFDGSDLPGFETVLKNNINEEVRRKRTRTPLQIRSDTAKGLGFEKFLRDTEIFTDAAPIVENPREQLKYKDRQKDFWYGKQAVQVKTITKVLGTSAYLNSSMHDSIMKSIKLNDFFIFGIAQIHGSRDEGCTVFTYAPGFAISSETLELSIRIQDESSYINLDGLARRPDHFQLLCEKVAYSG